MRHACARSCEHINLARIQLDTMRMPNIRTGPSQIFGILPRTATEFRQGIGDILATLEDTGQLENTLVFFMSDNGACAEVLPLDGSAEAFKRDRKSVV